MADDKLSNKIQELPETKIMKLKTENEKLKRQIIGLKKCWDDYESACQEIVALRKFLSQIYDYAHKVFLGVRSAMKIFYTILSLAVKIIPRKHKYTRNKMLRRLRKARQGQDKVNKLHTQWLYKWADDPLYKFY